MQPTFAAMHDHDGVAKKVSLLHVVCGQHHHAVLLERIDGFPDATAAKRVQASRGFYRKLQYGTTQPKRQINFYDQNQSQA